METIKKRTSAGARVVDAASNKKRPQCAYCYKRVDMKSSVDDDDLMQREGAMHVRAMWEL